MLDTPDTSADTSPTVGNNSASGRRREDVHLLELERQMRAYLGFLDCFPAEALMRRTRAFKEDVERLFGQLDRVRNRRGR